MVKITGWKKKEGKINHYETIREKNFKWSGGSPNKIPVGFTWFSPGITAKNEKIWQGRAGKLTNKGYVSKVLTAKTKKGIEKEIYNFMKKNK